MFFNIVWILIAVVSIAAAGFFTVLLRGAVKSIKEGYFWTYYPVVHYAEDNDCINNDCVDNRSAVEHLPAIIFLCLGIGAGVMLHTIYPLSVKSGVLTAFITLFCMALGCMNAIIFCQKYMHMHKIEDERNCIGVSTPVTFSALSFVFLILFLVTHAK